MRSPITSGQSLCFLSFQKWLRRLPQFNDFLTNQDKLTQHQSGNRKNHSTETLSLLVTDHIFRARPTAIDSYDPYRPQQGLRRYLPQYCLTDELTITHGVPQGAILDPLLFKLYINDLPSAVKSSCTNSYDTKIHCSFLVKNVNSCLVKMTKALHFIAGWCCSHQLLINPSKTKLFFPEKAASRQGIRLQSAFP